MESEKMQTHTNPKKSTKDVKPSTDKYTEKTFPPDGDALAVIGGVVEAVLEIIADCLS